MTLVCILPYIVRVYGLPRSFLPYKVCITHFGVTRMRVIKVSTIRGAVSSLELTFCMYRASELGARCT